MGVKIIVDSASDVKLSYVNEKIWDLLPLKQFLQEQNIVMALI